MCLVWGEDRDKGWYSLKINDSVAMVSFFINSSKVDMPSETALLAMYNIKASLSMLEVAWKASPSL